MPHMHRHASRQKDLPLVVLEGGAYSAEEAWEVLAGEEACLVARPQLPLRPDVLVVYGERAKPQVESIFFRGRALDVKAIDLYEVAKRRPGSVAQGKSDLHALTAAFDLRSAGLAIPPGPVLDVRVVHTGKAPQHLSANLLGDYSFDGADPQAGIVGLERVRHPSPSAEFVRRDIVGPGHTRMNFGATLYLTNPMPWRGALKRLSIETDAPPGSLYVMNLQGGPQSLLASSAPVSVEAFASEDGFEIFSESLFEGQSYSIQIARVDHKPTADAPRVRIKLWVTAPGDYDLEAE